MLIELMPGDRTLQNTTRNSKPAMTNNGTWIQYGVDHIKKLFDEELAVNMNFEKYCKGMGILCAMCNFMGIFLADVEFIVGFNGSENGVFMLDFDKVHAIDYRRVTTNEYKEKLRDCSFETFGTPKGVGFDAYATIQFPYKENEFNDEYANCIKSLLELPSNEVDYWMQTTERTNITPSVKP